MRKRFLSPLPVGAVLAALAALAPFAAAGPAPALRAPQGKTAESARSSPAPKVAPGVILDVPFVKQEKNACGPAAISMVMRYWALQQGRPPTARASQPAIVRALDPGSAGTANTALEKYLRDSGFQTFAFAGRWSDLQHHLRKGRPLIVGLGPENGKGPLHYVVVAGIDWKHDFVFLNDPARRKLFRMGRNRFEREWQATGNWTLLALPSPRG